MQKLPTPPKESIIYEDKNLYVCLALFPITIGHTIIVWKEDTEDLHSLPRKDYEYLMDLVDITRNILLDSLHIEKVYLMYMDEVKQVHWHLIPRYEEKGINVLLHTPVETKEFPLAPALRLHFAEQIKDFV